MHPLTPKRLELIKALLEQEGLKTAASETIPRRENGAAGPLSFGQERLWFFGRMTSKSPVFNIPAAYWIEGPLDVERLNRAFGRVIERHETLRTSFGEDGGRPAQHIADEKDAAAARVEVRDLSGGPRRAGEKEEIALAEARAEARRPFDLTSAPLVRLTLWRLTETRHLLLVTIHHIVSEVQSLAIFVRDLAAYYSATGDGAAELPSLEVQFADFAAWQRDRMEGERFAEQLAWWKGQLDGELPTLQLPTDHPRPAVQTFAGDTRTLDLPPALSDALRAFCRAQRVTPFAAAMAAWGALLSRYAGQDVVLVGTPVTDRDRSEIQDLIGFFVNTLVTRVDVSGDPSFAELVRRVRDFQLGAQANRELPFEQLVEELQVGRDLSRSPLFQVAFLYQTAEESQLEPTELAAGTRVVPLDDPLAVHTRTSKFDASLVVWDRPEGLAASFEYCTDLFDARTVDRMLGHLARLLEGALAEPERPLSTLSILTDAEEEEILHAWNDTETDIREDACIDALFEEQVDRTPDAVAVEFEGRTLTYRELDERANRLAHHLRELGVVPDQPVAIATERCTEMMVAILGTLKAGGAYLPIDLAYPKDRLAFLFENAEVRWILTRESVEDALPDPGSSGAKRIRIDADAADFERKSAARPARVTTAANLAYVIYTSGSTGVPKGVSLGHTGLVNLTTWHQRAFDVKPSDRATHLAGLAFDASVWEVWPYLTAGSALHLTPEEVRLAPKRLVEWMVEHRITQSFIPTPLCEAVLREELPPELSLDVVLTGGDKLHRAPERDLGFALFNQYGPTENTVVATATLVEPAPDDDTPPPIGRPIDNVQCYVLDRGMQPVPVGVPGELYIGGKSLALGYHGRPDLTEERFVPSPFRPGARLYATGDLVRWREDGQIEFMGRLDNQVKVRGFRIELGEIEAQLGAHPRVAECAVIIREGESGDGILIGYVVLGGGDGPEPTSEDLRAYLRQTLPEYMVPTVVCVLAAMPLTQNGKLDRRALPDPELGSADEFVDLESELEERIAAVWCEALEVERVGATSNFFDLGGHSLLLAQVHVKLQEAIDPAISIVELFRYPTVGSLAAHLSDRDGGRAEAREMEASRERGARRRAVRQTRSRDRRSS